MVEYIGSTLPDPDDFRREINKVLEVEKSAFRFVGDVLAPLTNEIEMAEVRAAIDNRGKFSAVGAHLQIALELFSRKPQPDYRNSIKEAISALEATATIIANKPKASLGEALKLVEMHEALRRSMVQMYGYTSDAGGIRHALTDESIGIDEHDARFMLIWCSTCTNYLIGKVSSSSAS